MSSPLNEKRIRLTVKLIVYKFECEDCGKKWIRRYVDDRGESYARSNITHRCSKTRGTHSPDS